VQVARPPRAIDDFAPYQEFLDRWIATRDELTARQGEV
jgi:hypothetical protein